MTIKAEIEFSKKLALSCNILAMEGHSDITLGHVTARKTHAENLYMKPSGLGLEEVLGDDIILIDLEGNKLFGKRERHSEYPIHTEICKVRSDVNCVIHTHPPFSTALAATGGSIKALSHEGVLFTNIPIFKETSELINDPILGQKLTDTLGNNRAVLMQNHGVVVVGESIEQATVFAILLEKAAQIQFYASSCSENTSYTPSEQIQRKIEQIYHNKNIQNFWDYYVRKLQRNR